MTENLFEISPELDYNPVYVGNRCRKLAKSGLLVNVGGGTYSITEQGEAFLDGDLDAAELFDPAED